MQPPIFVIYKNLPGFIEARKLKSTHKFSYDEKSLDNLVGEMEKVGYIDLKFETELSGKFVECVIIYANSEYAKKTPKLKQLIASIESSEDFVAGKINELIFIVPNEFVQEKRLIAVINEKRENNKKKIVKEESGASQDTKSGIVNYPYVRLCPYSMFIMNMTKKPEIPKSRIMTKEEVDKHLTFNRKNARDIQTISEKNDPIVTWLGAKKGDFIEQELLSRNAAFMPGIRRVI